ncbi:MAG: hypothetical protein GXP55_08870 [Deltaproteobacteria bacterium]|nr:hypothetical protein [Deltaproteobacteria bacterium]
MADVNTRRPSDARSTILWIITCVLLGLTFMPRVARAQGRGWGVVEQEAPTAAAPEPIWERPSGPRLLLLMAPNLESTRGVLSDTLSHVGSLSPNNHYMRAARRAGRPWNDQETFAELLPAEDVDLVVVVERTGRGRSARLRMSYRDGHTGELLLETIHGRGGDFEGTASRILREATLASRVVTEAHASAAEGSAPEPAHEPTEIPPGGEPEPEGSAEPESRSTVGVRILAGPGVGSAEAKISSDEGGLRLSVTRFAIVDTALLFDIVPSAESNHSFSLGVTYRTSVGLSVKDARGDGIIRDAPARVQRFEALGALDVEHGSRLRSTLELGWAVRTFDSPAELSFPDYSMTGPLLRVNEAVSLWQDGLTVAVGAEVNYVATISGSLRARGVANSAWALGWSGTLHLPLGEVLALQLAYREAQTFLPIANGNTGHTRERFIALRIQYRP